MSKTTVDHEAPDTRTITVRTQHIPVGEEWRSKEEIAQKERESRAFWSNIDDDKRQAILVLTRDALLRLIEDPDIWVPTSVEPASGNRIDIFISIHLAEVDDEVLRRRVDTEKIIHETTTDLNALHKELKPGETPPATP